MGFYVEVESKIDTVFEMVVSLPPAMVLDEFLDNVLCRRQPLFESLDDFWAACANGNVSVEVARETGRDFVPKQLQILVVDVVCYFCVSNLFVFFLT